MVDRTLIELARDIAMFRPVMETYVRGKPDALLLVEFAEDDQAENLRRLDRLDELMGDLGHPGSVVKVADAAGQNAVWEVRASGLNIMMSMKSEGKPVSFIEDCAVPLEHLADYTERLTAIFAKHGTRGTWYAHASVGCLHVRPVLNLKLEKDANTMRAIAEEAFALVKDYKGSHSGEHGDGLVRSEFHERMYGAKTVRLFEEVKDRFDPHGRHEPRQDRARLAAWTTARCSASSRTIACRRCKTALDWSAYPGAGGGFQGAVEMCNNNGECRKHAAGVMCPSFRVTGNERDVTRGRANSLRLAISGQLGPDALRLRRDAGDHEAVRLLQGLPARVPDRRRHGQDEDRGAGRRQRAPRPVAARPPGRLSAALCALCRAPGPADECARRRPGPRRADRAAHRLLRQAPAAALAPAMCSALSPPDGERVGMRGGTARAREPPLPCPSPGRCGERGPREVALFADTFNTYFEPENLRDAVEVLSRLGYRVTLLRRARRGAAAVLRAHVPLRRPGRGGAGRGAPAAGRGARRSSRAACPSSGWSRPACSRCATSSSSMLPGDEAERLAAPGPAARGVPGARGGRRAHPRADRASAPARSLLHGHCHQKAFGAMGAVTEALALVEGLEVETVESSCCGMAGAFGYGADTYEVSLAMGELSLLPAVRQAPADAIIAADGFSCRHQIHDGTGRTPAARRAHPAPRPWARPLPTQRRRNHRRGCDHWRRPRRWTLPRRAGRLAPQSANNQQACDCRRAGVAEPSVGGTDGHASARAVGGRSTGVIKSPLDFGGGLFLLGLGDRRLRRRLQPAVRAAFGHRLRADAEGRGRCWSAAFGVLLLVQGFFVAGRPAGAVGDPRPGSSCSAACSSSPSPSARWGWSSPGRSRSSSPRSPTRTRGPWRSSSSPWCMTLLCGLLFKELLNLPIPFDPPG